MSKRGHYVKFKMQSGKIVKFWIRDKAAKSQAGEK
jgi:hypothetical protein